MPFSAAQRRLGQEFFAKAGLLAQVGHSLSQSACPALHYSSWAITDSFELAVTSDSLIAGVHFLENSPVYSLGYKSLAVNLSDLAAMGAHPCFLGLTLVLPVFDADWLAEFVAGWKNLSDSHNTQLVFLELQQGPLSVHVQAYGEVEPGRALRRTGARVNDLVCVTGTLGDAAYGLYCLQHPQNPLNESSELAALVSKLHQPLPRVAAGRVLSTCANACIDLSDGLVADLGHICQQSGLGARLDLSAIPVSKALKTLCPAARLAEFILSKGDDYELCFTIDEKKYKQLAASKQAMHVTPRIVGRMVQSPGVTVYDGDREYTDLKSDGYEHFKSL